MTPQGKNSIIRLTLSNIILSFLAASTPKVLPSSSSQFSNTPIPDPQKPKTPPKKTNRVYKPKGSLSKTKEKPAPTLSEVYQGSRGECD